MMRSSGLFKRPQTNDERVSNWVNEQYFGGGRYRCFPKDTPARVTKTWLPTDYNGYFFD
jgi:hypothetical protein